jgi:predicted MFS family arabinose efflux permease
MESTPDKSTPEKSTPEKSTAETVIAETAIYETAIHETVIPKTAAAPLSRRIILLFAAACGLNVANIYYAHPLLDAMASDFSIDRAAIGIIVTLTQIGYALGLIFIVPLGDLVDRRRLILGQALLSTLALVCVGLAPTADILLAGMVAVGLLAVVIQVLVAFAASLAAPEERGHVVGMITSGVVLGILLARFVAGVLTDLGGWRSVYLTSAALMLMMAVLLFRVLPRQAPTKTHLSYPALLGSLLSLFREEPVLRSRAVFALLIFATFNVLWTPLVLPLTAPPYALSHGEIGLFGLAGVAGALGAGRAGKWADRGRGHRVTGLALALMLAAWMPIACLGTSLGMSPGISLACLVLGVVLLDLGIQAVHVTNQSFLLAIRPEARSRLVGGYMVFYSIGSAVGSIASTLVYAQAGWPGVCVLGASLSCLALLFWALLLWRTWRQATAAHPARLSGCTAP